MTSPQDRPAASSGSAADKLAGLLAQCGLPALSDALLQRFESYLALIQRWNTRMNLTAIRDEEGILSRHFVESIACAFALPPTVRALLDFGSGAGFPGIPIALCRPEIAVTLAESQTKKAGFLREAVRTLELPTTVYPGRAETLEARFDCVTLRAVDRMESAVRAASQLVKKNGCLVLMTTGPELLAIEQVAGGFTWQTPVSLPMSTERVIAIGMNAG